MFHPFLLKKNITEITVEELREMGVVGLLLDVDNTLTAHDSQELSPAVADWLETVMRAGMRPLIVSNGKKNGCSRLQKGWVCRSRRRRQSRCRSASGGRRGLWG